MLSLRAGSFAGGLVFAALAALVTLPWQIAAAPVLGAAWAAALAFLGLAVLYPAAIAPTLPRALAAGALAATLVVGVALITPGPATALAAATVVVGVVRSGFLYRRASLRAIFLEAALVGGGLLVARALGTPSPSGVAFAVWGFFLVQSLFFLAGDGAARPADDGALDPFERARRAALELLEER